MTGREPAGPGLRRGWTTGACATAAATAAYTALLTGSFPDPVQITLPKGHQPRFGLARRELSAGHACAAVVKDAGDDPDVTHGALVGATVRPGPPGTGVRFVAGDGVGTVTRPGLPLAVGEPAINPVPRRLITESLVGIATDNDGTADVVVEVWIVGGAELARHTWNPRLGIVGGLSVLGTTGVVIPYSCSAWIDSIRRGVDVARAVGFHHVGAATGSTSEATIKQLYGLGDEAILDMGDFAGAVLTYLRRHPIDHLTVAGGIGKLVKLGDGHVDLHSRRSQVDLGLLAATIRDAGCDEATVAAVRRANTALDALRLCTDAGFDLGTLVAGRARAAALGHLRGAPVTVDVVVIDRAGRVVGRSGDVPEPSGG
ncbi:cobalt-precorrin-5B (C(1))-methyltransferase [Pseudonocardia endophytica]|uniref:Cobalt-precorrin-5B C(1)-methyltransferase n=1 Tax=Pseudonocardia endophytica TaxID=401976 RepID=A0A4R1HLZ7_PSEEN|nr:cobalt-precorrin-5B (C(1))-methyltransferase [Pseudonocardia endophytica]TCK21340.1 cobalt-precorrin-5B (C1)-methyltransferase [Pseudonocardia endophytica]